MQSTKIKSGKERESWGGFGGKYTFGKSKGWGRGERGRETGIQVGAGGLRITALKASVHAEHPAPAPHNISLPAER